MSGLFTVLIAEKKHIDAIRDNNKLFFEPFLESKELAFCYWNPKGLNLSDSVPGLMDAVGRRKEWRAVIINNEQEAFLSKQNPFDVVDASAITSLSIPARQLEEEEQWEEWDEAWTTYYQDLTDAKESVYRSALSNPLQKLTTWLCYRPEEYVLQEVYEKQDIDDWAMEQISVGEIKPSIRLEKLERDQYKKELRLKEQLRREFVAENYLNVVYPSEVHCIALRTAENGFFDPNTFWNVHQENEYSAFADRNMYFDKMRFMVFDLLADKHRNFRNDYIRFLATVLVFASNPVPSSSMKARRLYQLEVETDDAPLCTLVTSYDKKLAATYDVISNEMERIRSEMPSEMTDKDAEAMFCSSTNVPVRLDESCNPEKAEAEVDYGLFFDSPEDEYQKWNRDYQVSKKELNYITRQQERAVRKSIDQLHFASNVSDVNINRLTSFQIEDIREYTDTAEDEMIASMPRDLTDTSEYTERMSKESQKVKKVISQRMTKNTTIVLSLIALGLNFLCFLPLLISNNNTSRTMSTAFMLIVGAIVVLIVIMIVALLYLRSFVTDAVKKYNQVVRGIMNDINDSLENFSKYLSTVCNVRRGHAVQNYAKQNLDDYTKSLHIRKKHQEDIRKVRAYLNENYHDYFGDKTFCDEVMKRPYEYDFDQKVEYTYPAPFLAGDFRQIEFMSRGNLVSVPSSFVTRILVKMEGIYDE